MTIHLELHDPLHIRIDTEDRDILMAIKDHFSAYVEGFRFMPQYGTGHWDGKVCMFNTSSRTLPYGLLTDFMRFLKKVYPLEGLVISPDIAKMFKCIENPQITQELKLFPRPYQMDCIFTSLRYGLGIIKSSVASGKSLVISYILNELFLTEKIHCAMILVPTKNLVSQFYQDLQDYGFDASRLGRMYEGYKEIDKEVVISTWQSMMHNHEILSRFQCVICDEVHTARAREIQKILSYSTNATVRLGFSGTLPISKLDMWQIQAYLGPVLKEYTSSDLAKLGYVSNCIIHAISVKYKSKFSGEYNDIKDNVFQNEYRLNLIKDILTQCDSNILILVGKVEKEGHLLKNFLDLNNYTDKEIVFIWGNTKTEERDHWRAELEKRKNIALIATYPIFSMGVNIPSLKYIILGSPFKSNIRVLQSIGRALRIHVDKIGGAQIFDIIDQVKFLNKHGDSRCRYYVKEGFDIIDHSIVEGDVIKKFLTI